MTKQAIIVYITITFVLSPFFPLAQDKEEKAAKAKEKVITAADLKSGNSQDVLISFFQLATENLTGDNKSFKFQSSLFAIKAKTNEKLWIDYNYLTEKFARNFNITINPVLDSAFKFKSNSIGFKYAIVNNRDKTVFDFSKPTDLDYLKLQREMIEEYQKIVPDENDKKYLAVLNFFSSENGEELTKEKDLPDEFKKIIKAKIKQQNVYKDLSPENFRDYLEDQYKSLAKYVENRGLLTVESNFSSLSDGKLFSAINFSSQYLKGMLKENSKMNLELDLKVNIDFADDTSSKLSADLNRQLLKLSCGFNWIIAKNKNLKSLVELKGSLAYNSIVNGIYISEKKGDFTAEGNLRFRITDDLWLPLEIKYNPTNGKVFGFLSAKFNFDWLKAKNVK